MTTIKFSRIWLLSVLLVIPVAGCYQQDLHHELPCTITIDQVVEITKVPSSTPVAVPPTLAPSIQAAPIPPPTPEPTAFPSSEPTSLPSVSPTSAPTDYPTSQPSSAPTSKPTKENCKANQNGFFGGMSGNPMLISYGYELETTPVSQDTLENEVLPSLKKGFVNSLLPELFGDLCASSRRLQSVRRRLEILGISSRPDDVPLSNVPCKAAPANTANNCSVVSGELTLFTSGNGTDEGRVIQDTLQAGMTSGKYVQTDSRIVRVTYVNLGSYSALTNGNTDTPKGTSTSSGSSNRYLIAIIPGIAAAILVIAAIVWRRRRRLNGDSDDSTNPSASRAPGASASGSGLDELPPGLPAPMSLEEGTVYTNDEHP